ncbi:VOC family protein [Thermodesulfobacteriota bacterium]
MTVRYKHTNVVARDWDRLACFYENIFKCVRVPPERHISGSWLEEGTGVKDARISGVHLRLPGVGRGGPTLEIFQYAHIEEGLPPKANRAGFSHIAFEVEDVHEVINSVLENGGSKIGQVTSCRIEGLGDLVFVYLADPEGNIIEVQEKMRTSS